jgi:hypothetical protein
MRLRGAEGDLNTLRTNNLDPRNNKYRKSRYQSNPSKKCTNLSKECSSKGRLRTKPQ